MIYEKLASYYDQFIDNELNDLYLKIIKKYFDEGTVIDLGTGTAPVAVELAKLGFSVTATDISPSMLEMAYNTAVMEDVHVNLYIHNILEKINSQYDIVTMTSDVINYLESKDEVLTVFENVAEALHNKSIFIFDALRVKYIEKMDKYHEDILMKDELIEWDVYKTMIPNQIKHVVKIGNEIETHIQTTYKQSEYQAMLKKHNLIIVEKKKLDERIVYVCKKRV